MRKPKEKDPNQQPVTTSKKKDAALEAFLSKMQKKAEKNGRECTLTKGTDIKPVEFFSTGILGMDICLGGGALGGVAKSRLIGISGPESSGKSTLALHVIAEAMKNDPELRAYYLDAEETYDAKYAASLAIDQNRIVVDSDNNAEDALTNMRDAINSGLFRLAVIDSTNALCPTKDLEGDVSGSTMGSLARVSSVAYRQLCGAAKRNGCSIMVIEQVRSSIGGYGNPEVTTVGNAGKFFMSQRVILRRQTKKNEENGVAVSNEVKVSVIKNKVGIPYRTHSLLCVYGKGFDQEEDIINLSTSLDIVAHSGAWYYYPDKQTCKEEHKWNGKEEYREYLLSHPEFKKEIFDKVNTAYNNADKTTVLQSEDSAALKKMAEEENAKAVAELQEQGIDISEVEAEIDE